MAESLRQRRVIIVDDDFEFRNVIAQALVEGGWQVRAAASGIQALEVIRRWRPDVILLDLMMPQMNGWEFSEEARRRLRLSGIPLVLMSARMDPHSEISALRAAAALAKPFDLEQMEQLLERLTETSPPAEEPV